MPNTMIKHEKKNYGQWREHNVFPDKGMREKGREEKRRVWAGGGHKNTRDGEVMGKMPKIKSENPDKFIEKRTNIYCSYFKRAARI